MDIYITGKNSKGNDQKIQIPIIPEEIESSIEGKFAEYDIYKLEKLAVNIQKASICGLGQSAPNPVISTLKYFKEEFGMLPSVYQEKEKQEQGE